ncbi:FAD-binding and (Fe-S)-binding domain-containing protein [Micromonospora sp. WMMD1120]|uniref:FAD-binding and (Fe-S)-binding domain-containing protein n=1 Tax=Micromonospora sp. WMMD1120 TaxID=3016106 RepID=UPI002417A2D6|nr:FAD-binding and (Fe-S)-binding domain-containing protein [Micromonospora sp. WMMD1120]MDG4810763.1 FAD-binding and (Fe-S)-binding domain-containing protein [Micromonospora sp. WMMD1120]
MSTALPVPSAADVRARQVADLLRVRLEDPNRISAELPRRLAAAHDASPYLFEPQAVVRASSAAEVGALMAGAREAGVPLTLRGGGTSLAGQAGGAGVLVDVRTDWRHAEVLDEGRRIRLQPGLTIRQANARLARYRRRLGPDPASEAACTVGGMVANNSSGMTCGTTDNAYRTMESLRFVLPSGTVVDSGARDADERLRAAEPELHAGLLRLRDRVRATPRSRATIERLFAMKNTMGYGLNSLLDHDSPVEMLAHLMIGSEGTLGFVAEATFRTVAIHDHAATGLLVLPRLTDATDALPALLAAGARTAELLDAAALRVSQRDPGASPALRGLAVAGHAALLVEFAEESAERLAETLTDARGVLDGLPAVTGTALTRDPRERAALWHLRKGLYTAVAGARTPGTTALLEDIAVPMPRLTGTCEGLIDLFDRHGYSDAVIFGHARDGNLHFMLTQSFDTSAEIDRYARFTDDMVDLVLAEGGTLKAEHGTGRAMAPFVRRQYGDELYDVMRDLKRLCDPTGLLNPGVLLNDDTTVHLRQLKAVPTVDPELDACVECGYCEPVCPTADVTTTPRQRIVLQRQIALATAAGDDARRRELTTDYAYAAVDSCAADSLCVTACPVGIDTGAAMKRLRAERHGPRAQRAAVGVARHWRAAVTGVRAGLNVAHVAPTPLTRAATGAIRALGATDLVPRWSDDMPRGGAPRPAPRHPADARAVFFAACIGSVFAAEDGSSGGAAAAFLRLCDLAGVPVVVPDATAGLCCGTPWQSKGYPAGHREMAERTLAALWAASDQGRLPVVCDASSCTHGLTQLSAALSPEDQARYRALRVVDSVTFTAEHLLPALPRPRRLGSLALHPTCSTVHLGGVDDLRAVAQAVADTVTVPESWGCCAFAGDRGLLHPEVTAAATAAQATEVNQRDHDAYASCNRTCEMGLSRATGQPYRHVLELLVEAVEPTA